MHPERKLTKRDLQAMTCEAWEGLAGYKLRPVLGKPPEIEPGAVLMALVTLRGRWEGGILLVCPADLVRRAAAALFGKTKGETTLDDMKDLLGEIANTIAGGLARWLPMPMELSLPTVGDSLDIKQSIPRGKIIYEMALDCESWPVYVLVLSAATGEAQPGDGSPPAVKPSSDTAGVRRRK